MELTGKMALVGFDVLWLGESGAGGAKAAPGSEKLQLGQELQVGGIKGRRLGVY